MGLSVKAAHLKLILKGGLNINKESQLSGKDLDKVLISSMFSVENMAFINSYETGLSQEDLKILIQGFWNIHDKEAALETIDHLMKRNKNDNIKVMYAAYEAEDYPDYLKFRLKEDEEELVKQYIAYLDRLFEVVPKLIEWGVFEDYQQVKKVMDSGWNVSLGSFLVRACYDYGYLNKKELIIYLTHFYDELKKYCETWEEYTNSYLLGRMIENWPQTIRMISKANKLLTAKNSPLKGKIEI